MTARMLGRTTFRINRLLGFGSPKQLIARANDREDQRPLVALKELVVNALDACEDAGITPVVLPGAGSDHGSSRAPPQ